MPLESKTWTDPRPRAGILERDEDPVSGIASRSKKIRPPTTRGDQTMYSKIARGYARNYMQSMRPRQKFEAQMNGVYLDRVSEAFAQSATAKKPGRVLRRVSKALGQDWMDLRITSWNRNYKEVNTRILTYDADARIEIQDDYDRTVFTDDLVQLNELFLTANKFSHMTLRGALGSATLHAITRVLEREGCTPDDLPEVVPEMLRIAHHIVTRGFTKAYPEATKAFMIPFLGGAFVAINCPIKPSQGRMHVLTDGLSIRTWLSPDMITPDMRARLEIMDGFLDATYHGQEIWPREKEQDAIEHNSRPYDYRARARSQTPRPTSPARTRTASRAAVTA